MALETGTYISDLVATNPTSTDPKSEGDNHLRLIKSTVKATFPNVTGAVTKTHTQLNNALDKTGDTMTGTLNISSGGNLLVTGSGGLGYGVGSGGTVTQATSKSTAVTLNKPSGQIAMNAASLGGGTTAAFTFNNSTIAATDQVLVTVQAGAGNPAGYRSGATAAAAGSCTVFLTNTTGSPLAEAVILDFKVIKGATS